MSTGYVVREDYLLLAANKPGGSRLDALEELIRWASEVDRLERSFATRLAAARGIAAPELSSAAKEEVALSSEADAEVHRLLMRRCRRAESAKGVLRELLAVAQDELEFETDLLPEFEDGDPAAELHLDLVQRKRQVVTKLRELARDTP